MKWTEQEINYLKENYKNGDKEEILNNLDSKNWKSVKYIAKKYNLTRERKNDNWSECEIKYLSENYQNEIKEKLVKNLPKRNWTSIKLMAGKLNLYRTNDFYRKSDMYRLMEDTNESFYWMGFLSADGHFNQKDKRININLSVKDKKHLIRFSNFVNNVKVIISENICSTSLQNIDVFAELCKKFDLKHDKTYFPPNFDVINKDKELFFSYIVGFIDGDGYINKLYKREDCNLGIHLHSSWLKNLIYIENFLYKYFNISKNKLSSKIGNDGYARMTISDSSILSKIKKEVIRLELPVLNRKWNIINENHISRYEVSKINKERVIKLYLEGLNGVEIIKQTKLKKGVVYSYIRDIKKEATA